MIHEEFTVGSNPEIEIRIQSGRIEIREGASGTVVVDVDTADPGFVVEQRGDLILVSSDKNASWLSRKSAFVRVEVPKGIDATVSTASADIECEAALGKVTAKTASGEIEISRAQDVVIKTASGDAEVRSVTGDIKVSSASGDVHVGEFGGKANFSAASGDVRIGSGLGQLVASTASGDVSIDTLTGRRANLKTMSGTVTVGIPPGTELDLDATILSGNLNLPEPSKDRPPTERRVSINAKLVSGDLNIRRA